jgi:hypothetical protein
MLQIAYNYAITKNYVKDHTPAQKASKKRNILCTYSCAFLFYVPKEHREDLEKIFVTHLDEKNGVSSMPDNRRKIRINDEDALGQ